MPSFSNTTSATSGAGDDYLSGAHEFITGFSGVRVARSLVFCVFCFVSLYLLLFWPLCFLSFFDLRILITNLDLHTFFKKIDLLLTNVLSILLRITPLISLSSFHSLSGKYLHFHKILYHCTPKVYL